MVGFVGEGYGKGVGGEEDWISGRRGFSTAVEYYTHVGYSPAWIKCTISTTIVPLTYPNNANNSAVLFQYSSAAFLTFAFSAGDSLARASNALRLRSRGFSSEEVVGWGCEDVADEIEVEGEGDMDADVAAATT